MNTPEQAFADWAAGEGWDVTKRGWPDFICRRNGELMAVEVKGPRDGLSRQQWDAISDLRRAGIPTFVWGPEEGFTEVGPPVGESVFSLQRTIAELRRIIEQLQNPPGPEPMGEPVSWTFVEDDPATIQALANWCRTMHRPKHDQYAKVGPTGSFCADIIVAARSHSAEKITATYGMTNAGLMRRNLERAHDFMVAWQHDKIHTDLAVRSCTGCAQAA